MIPGSGSSSGQGIGYPLQYSWASLVVQVVKNLPAMQETWVQPLGWEDLLEEGLATYYSILAWRIPMGRELSMGSERVGYDSNEAWYAKNAAFSLPSLILKWLTKIHQF